MNQVNMETIQQEMECINIAVLGISELNWTGLGYFQSDNYQVFCSENDKFRENGLALILLSLIHI